MIGYIDKLGIFGWDIDPDNKNGYLEEKIVENDNLFQILANKNEVIKAWKKDMALAYKIISGIYKSLIHKPSKSMSQFKLHHIKSYPDLEVNAFDLLLIDNRNFKNHKIESPKAIPILEWEWYK